MWLMWLIHVVMAIGLAGLIYYAIGEFGSPTPIRAAWGLTAGIGLILLLRKT